MTKMQTTTYVPPAFRRQKSIAAAPAKKTALKKEFQLEDAATQFPSLNETFLQKNNKTTTTTMGTAAISFSAAAAKKNEEIKTAAAAAAADVPPPGWVYIRRQNGQFQYKTGDLTRLQDWLINEEDRTYLAEMKQLDKYRLALAQYERDMDVVRLGDFSEYYGEPTLAERMERERLQELQNEEQQHRYNNDWDSGSGQSDNEY